MIHPSGRDLYHDRAFLSNETANNGGSGAEADWAKEVLLQAQVAVHGPTQSPDWS